MPNYTKFRITFAENLAFYIGQQNGLDPDLVAGAVTLGFKDLTPEAVFATADIVKEMENVKEFENILNMESRMKNYDLVEDLADCCAEYVVGNGTRLTRDCEILKALKSGLKATGADFYLTTENKVSVKYA